jgi:hypothetical protein
MIKIETADELLAFINRSDVTSEQSRMVVCKFFNLISLFEHPKDKIIDATIKHIELFGVNKGAYFLGQNLEFRMKDVM